MYIVAIIFKLNRWLSLTTSAQQRTIYLWRASTSTFSYYTVIVSTCWAYSRYIRFECIINILLAEWNIIRLNWLKTESCFFCMYLSFTRHTSTFICDKPTRLNSYIIAVIDQSGSQVLTINTVDLWDIKLKRLKHVCSVSIYKRYPYCVVAVMVCKLKMGNISKFCLLSVGFVFWN